MVAWAELNHYLFAIFHLHGAAHSPLLTLSRVT